MTETRLVVCVNERLGPGRKSCATSGSRDLIDRIRQRMNELDAEFPVTEQVCLGRCEQGVTMRIAPAGPFFTDVSDRDIDTIIQALQQFNR